MEEQTRMRLHITHESHPCVLMQCRDVSEFLGVDFNESMLYPSWNGEELFGDIAPWGTVLRSSEEYNKEVIDSLSQEEKEIISSSTAAIAKHFNYDQISYLKGLY